MKYKIIVDKQSRTNPSSEKREYEVDIEELCAKKDVYDSLVIKKDEAYVMRRLSLSEYHVLTVLEQEIKEPLKDLNIKLFEGDNYVYLVDMAGNKFYAEYIVKNDFTDLYVTSNEMNSAINQTASEIEFSVSQKLTGYSTVQETNSLISQTANEIKTLVTSSIGSTNTLLNSDFSNNFNNWDVTDRHSILRIATIENKNWLQLLNSEAGGITVLLKQKVKPFQKNINYTFSAKLKRTYIDNISNINMIVKLEFYDTDDNFIQLVSNTINIENVMTEQYISTTFKTPNIDNISYAKLTLQITADHTDLLMTNLQLEVGSVVTDWNISRTDYYSQIDQKINSIVLEVSKKVNGNEIISRINMSPEEILISAEKLALTAVEILNIISGNTINLTSKSISINSDYFNVDSDGNVTIQDKEDNGSYSPSLTIQRLNAITKFLADGINGKDNENNSEFMLDTNTLEIDGFYGSQFWFYDSDGNVHFSLKNGNNGVYPISIQENTTLKNQNGNTSLMLANTGAFVTGDGLYVNGYKVMTNTSDEALKKEIKNTDVNAIDIIKQIQHKQFNWKSDNVHQNIGYIAQELEKIDKNFVHKDIKYNKDGSTNGFYWQVNLLPIIATNTKAMQELIQKDEEKDKLIEELTKRIEKLEANV